MIFLKEQFLSNVVLFCKRKNTQLTLFWPPKSLGSASSILDEESIKSISGKISDGVEKK